ncbi:MAG: hypothetical protein WDN03_09000 [Rhizomicrobium sp.]
MKKGTLARVEINLSVAVVAVLLVLAGYDLVSALADRLDPKVRACVERSRRETPAIAPGDTVKLCKHLEAIGAL